MGLRRREVLLGGAACAGAAALSGCETPVASLLGGGEAATLPTRNGVLEGRVDADGVRVFKGVPFAAPPVGARRFRRPEPVEPWTGVLRAVDFAPMAMQPVDGAKSEDCLYLNVWIPPTPGPHPVYVWTHAGGNIQGRASDPRYDGAVFARKGVVCVTITHRVGVWGFLELGEILGPGYEDSGDNGLRDMVAAFEWVRDNIADFEGDPGQVTSGGLSGGAKNTCALLASPAAAGLFQSAIVESGGGQTVFTVEEARAMARRFMERGRIRTPEALLAASARRLLADQGRFADDFEASFPFRAVIGGDFLPMRPLDAIAAGSGSDVRLLIGSTIDEGALFLGDRSGRTPLSRGELGNVDLDAAEAVYARYQAAYPDEPSLDVRLRFISAEEYWVPTQRIADARAAAAGPAETYLYRFDWRSRGGRFPGRAPHGSQIPFTWGLDDPGARVGLRDDGAPEEMHDMWVRFIKGGSPAPANGPDWPVYRAQDRRLLAINEDFRLAAPDDAQLALWDGAL